MPFIDTDLYSVSTTTLGGQVSPTLRKGWTDPAWTGGVYKYNSSSFYNWEQDNLPLYDLEDRTYFNWEQHGFPTSSVTGMMFNVSDSGSDYQVTFPTVSSALASLPRTLRFPVIIEVAAAGDLGAIEISDLQFEEDGSLEIINRGFGKLFSGSGTQTSATITDLVDASTIAAVSSIDLSNTFADLSSLCVSTNINQGRGGQKFFEGWARHFITTPEYGYISDSTTSTTVAMTARLINDVSAGTSNFLIGGVPNVFSISSNYVDQSIASDIKIQHGSDAAVGVARSGLGGNGTGNLSQTLTRATGLFYGNSASSISVKNCTGPIYIRGFCVDGTDGGVEGGSVVATSQTTSVGFDIDNSEVVLEDCAVVRCKDAGVEINNSKVILNRGFIAYRNYELSSDGSVRNTNKNTPGLRAINSEVTLSSNVVSSVGGTGAGHGGARFRQGDAVGFPIDSPFCFVMNTDGIQLYNSTLNSQKSSRGTPTVNGLGGIPAKGRDVLVLQAFLNTNRGIYSKDSIIDFDNRISCFQNKIGTELESSEASLAEFSYDHNADEGLLANNSFIEYNKNLINADLAVHGPCSGTPFSAGFRFEDNGQHIVLNNSKMVPRYSHDMVNLYGKFKLLRNHKVDKHSGVTGEAKSILPSVEVNNNSELELIHPKALLHDWARAFGTAATDANDTAVYSLSGAAFGSAFRVTDSSKLTLKGSGNIATVVLGPNQADLQAKNAGIYAGNNSQVTIAGPTTIGQFGVDVLAEDNSVIDIGPHKYKGAVDVSGFNLDNPDNHTKVQLHSTRSGLVANRQSVMNMQDLGDFHRYWRRVGIDGANVALLSEAAAYNELVASGTTAVADFNAVNGFDASSFASGGYIQFFANPNVTYADTDVTGIGFGANQGRRPFDMSAATNLGTEDQGAYVELISTEETEPHIMQSNVVTAPAYMKYSFGGTCVRAVGGSRVNVRNVHFPCGFNNKASSGIYFDVSSGVNRDRLYIWNIADNSELHAAYCSVSSTYPGSAVYWGPSATYNTALGVPVSGAPSSTFVTSSLSVLDSFGLGQGGTTLFSPKSTAYGVAAEADNGGLNRGPFRIYFSPKGPAKMLGYRPRGPSNPAGLRVGDVYQILAQGYNPSGDVSCIHPGALSGIYRELQSTASTTVAVYESGNARQLVDGSAFYYTSALYDDDARNRVWLDDSAMNTFANAKNAAIGGSGRAKLVNYYRAIIKNNWGMVGEGHPGDFGLDGANLRLGYGLGFRSANVFDLDRDN